MCQAGCSVSTMSSDAVGQTRQVLNVTGDLAPSGSFLTTGMKA